jgi:hypothetical protein
MVEAKTQLLWLETTNNNKTRQLGRNRGIPNTQLGFSLDQHKKFHLSHCGTSGKFISLIATPIFFSMSRLFNNLFEIGHFPDLWKVAHVSSIYKRSGPKTSK